MALQSLAGSFLVYPPAVGWNGGTLAAGYTLDANGESIGFVLQAIAAGSIDLVSFGVQSLSVSGDVEVRIETVDGSGDPTGTLWATNTNATVAVGSVGIKDATLTAAATVARGDLFAVVLVAANSLNAYVEAYGASYIAGFRANRQYRPYRLSKLGGGAWAKDTSNEIPNIGVRYSGGTYQNLGTMLATGAFGNNISVAFNSGSSSNEYGLKFQVPFRCVVSGVQITSDLYGSPEIRMYDASNNVLAGPLTPDVDQQEFSSNGTPGLMDLDFLTDVTCEPNTVYRIGLKATVTSPDNFMHFIPHQATAHMDTLPGGQNFVWTHRAGGSWTDVTTNRPKIFLKITKLDDGVTAAGSRGILTGGRM